MTAHLSRDYRLNKSVETVNNVPLSSSCGKSEAGALIILREDEGRSEMNDRDSVTIGAIWKRETAAAKVGPKWVAAWRVHVQNFHNSEASSSTYVATRRPLLVCVAGDLRTVKR